MPNLRILNYNSNYELYRLIKAENLHTLNMKGLFDDLQGFLQISSKLKNLTIHNSIKDLYGTNLNLRKLSCGFYNHDIATSIKFLDSQKSTLEELSLGINMDLDVELIKCILQSLKLKKLYVNVSGNITNLSSFGCNDTIKELILQYFPNNGGFIKLLTHFSAVEKLEILSYHHFTLLELQTMTNALPKLETLILINFEMKIEKSERIVLENVKNLKITTFFECKNCNGNWKQLVISCPNIKKFELCLYSLTSSLFDLFNVLTTCKKLEHFQINAEKFELKENFYGLNLDNLTALKSITSTGNGGEDVIMKFKKYFGESSKLAVTSNNLVSFSI